MAFLSVLFGVTIGVQRDLLVRPFPNLRIGWTGERA